VCHVVWWDRQVQHARKPHRLVLIGRSRKVHRYMLLRSALRSVHGVVQRLALHAQRSMMEMMGVVLRGGRRISLDSARADAESVDKERWITTSQVVVGSFESNGLFDGPILIKMDNSLLNPRFSCSPKNDRKSRRRERPSGYFPRCLKCCRSNSFHFNLPMTHGSHNYGPKKRTRIRLFLHGFLPDRQICCPAIIMQVE
jgi:hypothetical protein